MSLLERRYRRLLFFYPRVYRRERADEMVSTLMELAPERRTRPTWREAFNLVRHGLRARLGRPASRTVVVWAGLAAVLCGLFGGAIGTRLGWETARPLPSADETRAVFAEVLPGHRLDRLQLDRGLFSVGGQELTWRDADFLLTFDGNLYQPSAALAFTLGDPPIAQRQTLQTARERLSAAGWDLHPAMSLDANGRANADPAGQPERYRMSAVRGDTILELNLYTPEPAIGYLSLHLGRATPWTVYPAGIGAGLLGLALGWMAFGWASRRTEERPVVQTLATICYGLGMPAWILPPIYGVRTNLPYHLSTPRPRWDPMWEWLGLPYFTPVFLFGCGCALVALALAALPRWRAGAAREGAPA